ncbi:hypothetical protein NMG60_11033577 [Bertholletia excelsa]
MKQDDSFCSAPASPLKAHQQNSSMFDEFEFETSKRFRVAGMDLETYHSSQEQLQLQQQQQRENEQERRGDRSQSQSVPTMAFADELFSDGHVLPLTPPPSRLTQFHSPAASPPFNSPIPSIKFPRLPRRNNAWNDEFDPFVVALENVKSQEDCQRSSQNLKHNQKRARSLSPLRTSNIPVKFADPRTSRGNQFHHHHHDSHQTYDLRRQNNNDNVNRPVHGSHELPTKPFSSSLPLGHTIKPSAEGYEKTDNRRQRVKAFLQSYSSFGSEKGKSQVKLKQQILALWKRSYLGRLSFKPKENAKISNTTKTKDCQDPRKELAPYRPSLNLCMSFGAQRQCGLYSP